jgi:2-polyprenyl-3-methyl-5-hydroxy-6-metoxy-1,4-benzoquinol methylase
MKKKEILDRIWAYRELCLTHVYSEPDTQMHQNVMDHMIPKFVNEYNLDSSKKILDIGCGQGYGMLKFVELGCTNVTGLTLSADDVKAARARGFAVVEEDMSFQGAEDEAYDVLFARHSLEHSPYPLLTLLEFNRILKPGGIAYIEMPSPQCTRALEEYDNHYAIMGARQWRALMIRAGFDTLDIGELKFGISNNQTGEAIGEEVYEWYVLKKS